MPKAASFRRDQQVELTTLRAIHGLSSLNALQNMSQPKAGSAQEMHQLSRVRSYTESSRHLAWFVAKAFRAWQAGKPALRPRMRPSSTRMNIRASGEPGMSPQDSKVSQPAWPAVGARLKRPG